MRVVPVTLALIALVTLGCPTTPRPDPDLPSGRACTDTSQCCDVSPSALCSRGGFCERNEFCGRDPACYGSRYGACGGPQRENCSNGVDDDDDGLIDDEDPECAVNQCNGTPEQIAVRALAGSGVTVDPCQLVNQQQDAICAQNDQQLRTVPTVRAYSGLLAELKVAADLSPAAPIEITPDLLSVTQFSGGVAGHRFVIVDGKFLDIVLEFATYLVLSETGASALTPLQAIDQIVNAHNAPANRGRAVGPIVFTNPPTGADGQRVGQYLRELAGAVVYHEFGHYWARARVDQKILSASGASMFFPFATRIEDDGDFVSGVLNAKAGHSIERVHAAYDIMTFYALNRLAGVPSMANVAQSYEINFRSSNPAYRPLNDRKQIVQFGYTAWAQFGP